MKKTSIFKRISAVFFAVLMIVSCFSFSASARNLIKRNDACDVPCADPVIDGEIGAAEGWSDPIYMNKNYTHNFVTSSVDVMRGQIDVFFAYSEEGIYFAAEIDESEADEGAVVLSTGRDIIKAENEGEEDKYSRYGFNGDVFVFSFDPFDHYINSGYRTYDDCAPWYCIGLFEDGAQMYHSYCEDGVLTEADGIKLVGVNKGGEKWCFEAMVPWDIVIADMEVNSYNVLTSTVEELTTKCSKFSALCGYRDMFYDKEMMDNSLYGIFTTCGDYAKDGMDVTASSDGLSVRFFALELYIGGRLNFTDVQMGQWFYKGAGYCKMKGLLNGVSDTEFGPSIPMTRAMIVTALGNYSKINSPAILKYYSESHFSDVDIDQWYGPYVEWARKSGIVAGYEDGTFLPNKQITREELSIILRNYANHIMLRTKSPTVDVLDTFADKDDVSDWAVDSVGWAVQNGIISGTGNGIKPKDLATRAQVAVMLFKLLNTGYNEFWY
ncbi:MAG: S-layer homology domain-containing protein [Clostridia bacterium]|nr:S-layer homology domain-containing protein [Clostridia bacterium]